MSDGVLCVREFTSDGMNEFKVGDKRMTKRTGDKRGMELPRPYMSESIN